MFVQLVRIAAEAGVIRLGTVAIRPQVSQEIARIDEALASTLDLPLGPL